MFMVGNIGNYDEKYEHSLFTLPKYYYFGIDMVDI
jgi:hypothetical protein